MDLDMTLHLADHRPKSPPKRAQFPKRVLKYRWEREEAECVTCRCGIKHDHGEFHRFHVSLQR
jgi:hypothetical protein